MSRPSRPPSAPPSSTAGPSDAQEDPAAETDQVRDRQAMVAVDLDVMQATGDTVTAALGDLSDQVEAEKAC